MTDAWPGTPVSKTDQQWPGTPLRRGEPPSSFGQTALDVGKSLGRGVIKGATGLAGLPGDVGNLIGEGVRRAGDAAFGTKTPPEAMRSKLAIAPPTSQQVEHGIESVTGPLGQPKTEAGRIAQSVGEFVPSVVAGPGGWTSKILAAFGGGVGSEVAGEITEGSDLEPYARIVGGIAGGLAPNIAGRVITPLPASDLHLGHVQSLEKEGVKGLTAGERSGYRPLRYMEEHLGGSPMAGRISEERFALPREQFTRAALARIGASSDRATPAVIDRAADRIGQQFDTLAKRNDAPHDPQYMQDILKAQTDYDFLFDDPLKSKVVQNVIDHAVNKVSKSNTMTGPEYKALRSRIERMRRGYKQDPELSEFLASVRDAMDGLMERAIKANNPADLGAWKEVRRQYRNLLVLEYATTGQETGGLVNPSKLKQAVVHQDRRAYARGKGDFAELTRAGENVMPGLPQSGTAPRTLTSAGPLKLVTTGATGRALMSGPVQAYLGNQSLTDILSQLPPAKVRTIQSILSNSFGLSEDQQ